MFNRKRFILSMAVFAAVAIGWGFLSPLLPPAVVPSFGFVIGGVAMAVVLIWSAE